MAFDRHTNLVLGDCEEFRKLPPILGSLEERRTLGLVLLRGEEVVSLTVEGPPPPDNNRLKVTSSARAIPEPGQGRATSRGVVAGHLAQAQPGLAGPVHGIGGPSPGMMQPQISRPPIAYPLQQQQPLVPMMLVAPPPFRPGGPPGGFLPPPPWPQRMPMMPQMMPFVWGPPRPFIVNSKTGVPPPPPGQGQMIKGPPMRAQ